MVVVGGLALASVLCPPAAPVAATTAEVVVTAGAAQLSGVAASTASMTALAAGATTEAAVAVGTAAGIVGTAAEAGATALSVAAAAETAAATAAAASAATTIGATGGAAAAGAAASGSAAAAAGTATVLSGPFGWVAVGTTSFANAISWNCWEKVFHMSSNPSIPLPQSNVNGAIIWQHLCNDPRIISITSCEESFEKEFKPFVPVIIQNDKGFKFKVVPVQLPLRLVMNEVGDLTSGVALVDRNGSIYQNFNEVPTNLRDDLLTAWALHLTDMCN